MTLDLMGEGARDKPEGDRLFIGAYRLTRGRGILYLMESAEAAK